MNKKKTGLALVLIVALLLTAIGGTLAYFTDTEEAKNVFTVGNVKIAIRENGTIDETNYEDDAYRVFLSNYKVMPNVAVDKNVWVKNTGNQPAYIRVIMTISKDLNPDWTADLKNEWNHSVVETPDSYIHTFERIEELAAGGETGVLLDSFMLKPEIDYTTSKGTYEIPVFAYAIQAAGFETAADAYKALPSDFYEDENGIFHIRNANGLFMFANEVNVNKNTFKGETVVLDADIDLAGRQWAPIGNVLSYPSITFAGTFDGNGKTISNMYAVAQGDGGEAAAGLFGSITGVVKNVTVDKATVISSHYAGGIVGYSSANVGMEITNCKVTNSTITSAPELMANGSYDNGDKAGGIIGYMVAGDKVDGCTVENTTIKAYRDLGGIVGYAAGTVTNNSVKNVTLIIDKVHNYKNYTTDAEHDANAFVGEDTATATVSNNKDNGVDHVEGVTAGTVEELKDLIGKAQASEGSVIINLDKDFDVEGKWVSFDLGAYNGVNSLTINGYGHTISGLNLPLITGVFAGGGTVTINGLTIKDSTIVGTTPNNLGIGAFLAHSDASGSVVLNDCHLVDSSVECTNGYAGGLVGYSSAATNVFTNCSVTNSTIKGQKSAGAIIGHGSANVTVEGCKVIGCTIVETLEGRAAAGAAAIAGRMSGGDLILKGEITVQNNTITQGAAVTETATSIYCANATPVTDEATLVN